MPGLIFIQPTASTTGLGAPPPPPPTGRTITTQPPAAAATLLRAVSSLSSFPFDFTVGSDTCGFTSSAEITCDSADQYCTNIGRHRGCCSRSDNTAECMTSLWTACVAYGRYDERDACDGNTLCCWPAMPYCVTHAYSTDATPGQTFTNVACSTTPGFGELFPYPPELMALMTTATESGGRAEISMLTPLPSSAPSSSSKASVGAIVGAVCGVLAAVIIVAVACFFLLRRRRNRLGRDRHRHPDQAPIVRDHATTDKNYADVAVKEPKSKKTGLRTRPLSTIAEQQTPVSPTAPGGAGGGALSRYKSARRSYGPHWPLGQRDPLEAHPPVDLEKRLSEPRGAGGTVPMLRIPETGGAAAATTAAPAGAEAAPTPPPPLSARSLTSSQSLPKVTPKTSPASATTTATSAAAAAAAAATVGLGTSSTPSPRLSYAPTSPMDTAFEAEMARRARREAEGGEGGADSSAERVSLVSMPSMPGDDDDDDDRLVSPVSPIMPSPRRGLSPATVSPMNSPRPSFEAGPDRI